MAKQNNKGSDIKVAGAFLAGAVVSAVAGAYYLFGAKEAKQNRKKVEVWTVKAKAEVLGKLEKAKKLSQDEYEKIVDVVSDKYSKVKEVGEDKADKFRSELKKHWKEIKKEAEVIESKGKKIIAIAKENPKKTK